MVNLVLTCGSRRTKNYSERNATMYMYSMYTMYMYMYMYIVLYCTNTVRVCACAIVIGTVLTEKKNHDGA